MNDGTAVGHPADVVLEICAGVVPVEVVRPPLRTMRLSWMWISPTHDPSNLP